MIGWMWCNYEAVADNQTRFESNVIQIQHKYNTNTTQIQHKYNANTIEVQHKYERNPIEMQQKYSTLTYTATMCYFTEGGGNNRRTDQIPENPARFHCGVVLICWHASRIQINGIWEVAWTLDLLYPLNFTHWSEPSGRDWTTENKPLLKSFERMSGLREGGKLPREDLTKGGRVRSILGGTKREQRRRRWQGEGASHATFWPQACTCCLLMALFCVNMPPHHLEGTWVLCPTMESIWSSGARILPHTIMNVYIVVLSEWLLS